MISNLKKYEQDIKERPYLYLEHEKQVLQLAKEAIQFIDVLAFSIPLDDNDNTPAAKTQRKAAIWLKEHE
jgi:hypothetical protein